MLIMPYCVTALLLFTLAGCSVAPLQASRTEATLELEDGRRFTYFSNKFRRVARAGQCGAG